MRILYMKDYKENWVVNLKSSIWKCRLSQIAKSMGPTWVLSDPDGPHVGPMNLVIRVLRLLAPNADDVESTTLLPINHIPLYETTSRPHTMSLYLRDICTLSVYLRTICHQRQSIMLDNGCWFLCRTWIVWMRGVARPRLPSKDGWCWV